MNQQKSGPGWRRGLCVMQVVRDFGIVPVAPEVFLLNTEWLQACSAATSLQRSVIKNVESCLLSYI